MAAWNMVKTRRKVSIHLGPNWRSQGDALKFFAHPKAFNSYAI